MKYTGHGTSRKAHYVCNEGYYLHSGSDTRKCTGGGTYDGILPLCRRMTCKKFELFQFSILNEVNISGTCFVLKLFWSHNRYYFERSMT